MQVQGKATGGERRDLQGNIRRNICGGLNQYNLKMGL